MKDDGLIAKVTRDVCTSPNGRRTINHLAERYPDIPRESLQRALQNAGYNGFIHLLMKPQAQGQGKGTTPGVWGPVPEWELPPDRREEVRRIVGLPYKPQTVWMHVEPHPNHSEEPVEVCQPWGQIR